MPEPHDITGIASLRRVAHLPRRHRVSLHLPFFAREEATRFERSINTLLAACGCDASAAMLVAAVVGSILFDATHWPLFTAHIFKTLGLNLLACFLAACVGKAAGLAFARWQLMRLVASIATQLGDRLEARQASETSFHGRTLWDA